MHQMSIRIGLCFLVFSIGIGVSAQTQIERTATARFDTASVRSSQETVFQALRERSLVGMKIEPQRVSIGHSTLFELIRFAYDLDFWTDEIVGPDWLLADQKELYPPIYDVEATFAEKDSARVRQMLQRLLAERFKLKARVEHPFRSGTLLVVARSGITFKREVRMAGAAVDIADDGFRLPTVGGMNGFEARTTRTLARFLSSSFDEPVVDRTDLGGRYDIHFVYPKNTAPVSASASSEFLAGIKAGVSSLGLVLLEHQQIPSTRVVVEHVERNPTEK